jgi:predicted transcriptional regulator
MRRSKLEIYLDVLEAFTNNGPMRLTRVTLKSKTNYVILKQITTKLIADNLVEEKRIGNFSIYSSTPKAKTVISQLRQVRQNLPALAEYLTQ